MRRKDVLRRYRIRLLRVLAARIDSLCMRHRGNVDRQLVPLVVPIVRHLVDLWRNSTAGDGRRLHVQKRINDRVHLSLRVRLLTLEPWRGPLSRRTILLMNLQMTGYLLC